MDHDDFIDEHNQKCLQATLSCMATNMDSALGQRGSDVNRTNTFECPLDPCVSLPTDCTSQQLVIGGKSPTSVPEMWVFIGTSLCKTSFNGSTDQAWWFVEKCAEGFVAMEQHRFQSVMSNPRGRDVAGRTPSTGEDT